MVWVMRGSGGGGSKGRCQRAAGVGREAAGLGECTCSMDTYELFLFKDM